MNFDKRMIKCSTEKIEFIKHININDRWKLQQDKEISNKLSKIISSNLSCVLGFTANRNL